jgi:hypothetical protein
MEKTVQLKQQDIDAISDKDVENEVCLGCDNYEFSGTLEVKSNTKLIIPLGTTLKITN